MNIEKYKSIKITPLLDTLKLIDIDDEEYFKLDYISNSKLKYINPEQEGTPAKYFGGMPKLYSDSLYFGSAVHELLLQPNEFTLDLEADRPTGKAGFMADLLYPIYEKYKKVSNTDIIEASKKIGYYENGLSITRINSLLEKCEPYWKDRSKSNCNIFLGSKAQSMIIRCISSFNSNKEIQELIHPEGIIQTPLSLNEQTIIMSFKIEMDGVEPFNLTIKAKLDNFTIDLDSNRVVLNDLKTTGHTITDFKYSFENYHYARQMGLYGYLIVQYANKMYNQNFSLTGNMLLVSTIPEYEAGVYKVKSKDFLRGFEEFKALLKLVAYYTVYKNEI